MIFGSMQLLLTTTLLRMTTGDLTENRQKLTYLQLSLVQTSPYHHHHLWSTRDSCNTEQNKQTVKQANFSDQVSTSAHGTSPRDITLIIGVFPKVHRVSVSRVSF